MGKPLGNLQARESHRFLSYVQGALVTKLPGGWQILFPNAGDDSYNYGVMHNFHGEACQVPWTYKLGEVTDTKVQIIFSTLLYKSPFAMERIVTIDQVEQCIELKESVTNQGQQALYAEWGQHIAFGAPFVDLEHGRAPARSVESYERDSELSRLKKVYFHGRSKIWVVI